MSVSRHWVLHSKSWQSKVPLFHLTLTTSPSCCFLRNDSRQTLANSLSLCLRSSLCEMASSADWVLRLTCSKWLANDGNACCCCWLGTSWRALPSATAGAGGAATACPWARASLASPGGPACTGSGTGTGAGVVSGSGRSGDGVGDDVDGADVSFVMFFCLPPENTT